MTVVLKKNVGMLFYGSRYADFHILLLTLAHRELYYKTVKTFLSNEQKGFIIQSLVTNNN